MNDDLYELMRREADQAPIGDRHDVRRGRARLRRRRLFTGGTGVAGVALAAALVGGYIPVPGQGADSGPASTAGSTHRDLEELADRTGRAITKAMNDYTRIEEFGLGKPDHGLLGGQGIDADGHIRRLVETYWYQQWHEAGGVGYLQATVSRGFDDGRVPPSWFNSCARRFGGWTGHWPEKYDDCHRREVGGQPVLVGVEQRGDRLWILVKYLRADDVTVELGFSSPYPRSAKPVLDPSLTTAQLVEVVSDPRVRLYLDG